MPFDLISATNIINPYVSLNIKFHNLPQISVTEKDKIWLVKSLELTKLSEHPIKMGAIYTYKNKLLAKSNNQLKSHPYQKHWQNKCGVSYPDYRYQHKLHAELAASRFIDKDELKYADLYIVRIDKENKLRCSYPCQVCMEFLQDRQVSNVICINADCQPVRVCL